MGHAVDRGREIISPREQFDHRAYEGACSRTRSEKFTSGGIADVGSRTNIDYAG